MPVTLSNLYPIVSDPDSLKLSHEPRKKLTASGSNFPPSTPPFTSHPFVRGMSITPSTITWATCTPFGPNSRARLWPSARAANLPAAKVLKVDEPRIEAVAPVMSREGG